jgi:hypothetical protein
MTNNDKLFADIAQELRSREVELRRTIARILDGDRAELVRCVVERVTEAMCMCVAYADLDEDQAADLTIKMVDAKFKAYREATGREYETLSTRYRQLRHEIRESGGPKPQPDTEEGGGE